jgi:hypothetical protein
MAALPFNRGTMNVFVLEGNAVILSPFSLFQMRRWRAVTLAYTRGPIVVENNDFSALFLAEKSLFSTTMGPLVFLSAESGSSSRLGTLRSRCSFHFDVTTFHFLRQVALE